VLLDSYSRLVYDILHDELPRKYVSAAPALNEWVWLADYAPHSAFITARPSSVGRFFCVQFTRQTEDGLAVFDRMC